MAKLIRNNKHAIHYFAIISCAHKQKIMRQIVWCVECYLHKYFAFILSTHWFIQKLHSLLKTNCQCLVDVSGSPSQQCCFFMFAWLLCSIIFLKYISWKEFGFFGILSNAVIYGKNSQQNLNLDKLCTWYARSWSCVYFYFYFSF